MTQAVKSADLESRRVWAALSELFLDTEINVRPTISSLQASRYSRTEIEGIMKSEVAPVLGGNLLGLRTAKCE